MIKFKKSFIIFILLSVAILVVGCFEEDDPPIIEDPVTITIAGSWEDCRGIDEVGRLFTKKYPNCTIHYESLQLYEDSVIKRLNGENMIDLFFTQNIQTGSKFLPYVVDLNRCEGLDLSNTFEGLIDNFIYRENLEKTGMLYAIPLGGEMRGLYVNKTLLNKVGITSIPKNQKELLRACAKLKEEGYIPFHGNPGEFSQLLLYPWVANIIANAEDYEATYQKVESQEKGITELFTEPFELLYKIVENRYYDYKTAQSELNLFVGNTDKDYVNHFLNIEKVGEDYQKIDDIGQIAFMPKSLSMKALLDKTKEDYHSNIEYAFIPAPVATDGGFVYMSPSHGIAANKNSNNLEWSIKFLDFLFQPDNNKLFSEYFNTIPNTKEAFTYISEQYVVPNDHISHLGQVTFSYEFYNFIKYSLVEVSKANNPKYMVNLNKDVDGNIQYYTAEDNSKFLYMFNNSDLTKATKIAEEYIGAVDPTIVEDNNMTNHGFIKLEYYMDLLKESLEK